MKGKVFKVALGAGFLLGLVVLIESAVTYRYVADHLVIDHLTDEAGHFVSLMETRARQEAPKNGEELEVILGEVLAESSGRIAWVRVSDQQREVIAVSGQPDSEAIAKETAEDLLKLRAQRFAESRETARGDLLVVSMPFRFQFSGEPPGTPGRRRPRFKLAEVAMSLQGEAAFLPLRRNLTVTALGAVALLASLALVAFRIGSYLRGRELEQQLQVARSVQAALLPHRCPSCSELDFAVEFRPAFDVGGDYYDVFFREHGQAMVVLADVSGKGLPAALLAAVVQGTLRTVSGVSGVLDQVGLTNRLNQFLHQRTSGERFVTLFWASFDPVAKTLKYVNAGHLPPILLHGTGSNCPKERLETGGPVLGLLPKATYEQGVIELRDGDLLVLYSDGLIEAADVHGVEFGEERLAETIADIHDSTPQEIVDDVLRRLDRFIGKESLHDDLTLLVVRVQDQPRPDRSHNPPHQVPQASADPPV